MFLPPPRRELSEVPTLNFIGNLGLVAHFRPQIAGVVHAWTRSVLTRFSAALKQEAACVWAAPDYAIRIHVTDSFI
jgi:hypothetical protein